MDGSRTAQLRLTRLHGVGIVGPRDRAERYLRTLRERDGVSVVAHAEHAKAPLSIGSSREPQLLTVEHVLENPLVQTVVNLVGADDRVGISLQAIAAGKNVYCEQPFARTAGEGIAVVDAAQAFRTRFGAAPDSVLGTGIQTAHRSIADGAIGRPTAAFATLPRHTAPESMGASAAEADRLADAFPTFSALVMLLGPVVAVTVSPHWERPCRNWAAAIRSATRVGAELPEPAATEPADTPAPLTPTPAGPASPAARPHLAAILQHQSGQVSTISRHDDDETSTHALFVQGTAGALLVEDIADYSSAVHHRRAPDDQWRTLQHTAGYVRGSHGIGVISLVAPADQLTPPADSRFAAHVLEVLTQLAAASEVGGGTSRVISSTFTRRDALPLR